MAEDLKTTYLKTIFQFKNLINTEFGRDKQHTLSLTDLLVMQGIDNGQSSVEIASNLHITKAAVSQCTTTLAKKNLITRSVDVKNRRNLTLALTNEGHMQLATTSEEFNTAFKLFVKQMGKEDLIQLLRLMDQMSTIIEND